MNFFSSFANITKEIFSSQNYTYEKKIITVHFENLNFSTCYLFDINLNLQTKLY